MAILSIAVPVPAAVGVGASVSVAHVAPERALYIEGAVAGDEFQLEVSVDEVDFEAAVFPVVAARS